MNYYNIIIKSNLQIYDTERNFYDKFQITLLMENANTHLVSVFKDYLLFDDTSEFFKKYYDNIEGMKKIRSLIEYYVSSSYLFPNYTVINEGKYIYKNIIRKQKLIDYLEYLEEENKKEKKYDKNLERIFNTIIFDDIIKETGNDSKINELFNVKYKKTDSTNSILSLCKLAKNIKDSEKTSEKINETRQVMNKNNFSKNISQKITNQSTNYTNSLSGFVPTNNCIQRKSKMVLSKNKNRKNKLTSLHINAKSNVITYDGDSAMYHLNTFRNGNNHKIVNIKLKSMNIKTLKGKLNLKEDIFFTKMRSKIEKNKKKIFSQDKNKTDIINIRKNDNSQSSKFSSKIQKKESQNNKINESLKLIGDMTGKKFESKKKRVKSISNNITIAKYTDNSYSCNQKNKSNLISNNQITKNARLNTENFCSYKNSERNFHRNLIGAKKSNSPFTKKIANKIKSKEEMKFILNFIEQLTKRKNK